MTKATAKALATLRHVAAIGLPPATMFEAVSRTLAEIVPFESATLVLYDDDLEATDAFLTHELRPEVAHRYFERWFNRDEEIYVPTHAQAARRMTPDAFAVSDYTPKLWETELYDEVFRDLGFHHMASMTLRRGNRAVGNISMGRPAAGGDFSAADVRTLREVASFAALALSGPANEDQVIETSALDEVETGLVVCDLDGGLQQFSPNATRMLRWASLAWDNPGLIKECLATPAPLEASYEWARPMLKTLADRVMAALHGKAALAPILRRTTRHGDLVLRAHAMNGLSGCGGPQMVIVEIQRRTPLDARLFRSGVFRSLSAQEQVVCRLFLKRLSQGEIAQMMGVSPHTVVSHVRNIYARTGASSREGLHEALLPQLQA